MTGTNSPSLFNARTARLRAAGIDFRIRIVTTDKNFRMYYTIIL